MKLKNAKKYMHGFTKIIENYKKAKALSKDNVVRITDKWLKCNQSRIFYGI